VVGTGVVGAAVVAGSVVVGTDVTSLVTGSVTGTVVVDAAAVVVPSFPPDAAAPMMIRTTMAPTTHGHFFLRAPAEGSAP
jgi:hypothetical protein